MDAHDLPATPWDTIDKALINIRDRCPRGLVDSQYPRRVEALRRLLENVWELPLLSDDREWIYGVSLSVSRGFNEWLKARNYGDPTTNWQIPIVNYQGGFGQLPSVTQVLEMLKSLSCTLPTSILDAASDAVREQFPLGSDQRNTVHTWAASLRNSQVHQRWDEVSSVNQLRVLEYIYGWVEADAAQRSQISKRKFPEVVECGKLAFPGEPQRKRRRRSLQPEKSPDKRFRSTDGVNPYVVTSQSNRTPAHVRESGHVHHQENPTNTRGWTQVYGDWYPDK